MRVEATEAAEQKTEQSKAAQARVTALELAQAAAALDSRRAEEDAKHLHTIELEQGIRDLHLNATPEELLQEVERLRREGAQKRSVSEGRKVSSLLLAVILASPLVVMLLAGVLDMNRKHRSVQPPTTALSLQSLAQAPDNTPVHANLITMNELAKGKADWSRISVDARPETEASVGAFNNEWTLFKRGGRVYVRGWATADQALNVTNEQAATVFANRPIWLPAAKVVNVEFVVDRISSEGYQYDHLGNNVKDNANSVTQGVAVHSVEKTLNVRLQDAPFWHHDTSDGSSDSLHNDVSVTATNGEMHVKGEVDNSDVRRKIVTLIQQELNNLNSPDRIVDEMTLAKKAQ